MSRLRRRVSSSSGRRFFATPTARICTISVEEIRLGISSKLWAYMLRVVLLIAMIFQVLGCSYACTATFASQDGSPAVGCRCCQAKRLSAQDHADRNLPADRGQEESHTACFCKSPVKTADSVQTDNELVSSPIWTIVDTRPQLSVENVSAVSSELRPPTNESGMGLRLAVQSLLL